MGIPNDCMSAWVPPFAKAAELRKRLEKERRRSLRQLLLRLAPPGSAFARKPAPGVGHRGGVSQRCHFVRCKVCLPVLFHRWEPSLAWSPFCNKEFSFYTCHIGWNFLLYFFSRRSRNFIRKWCIFAIWMYMVLLGGKHDILKNIAIVGMYVSTIYRLWIYWYTLIIVLASYKKTPMTQWPFSKKGPEVSARRHRRRGKTQPFQCTSAT